MQYYQRNKSNGKLRSLQKYAKDSWVDIVNPSEEEIDFLVKTLKLNADHIVDGLDADEIPRFEEENGIIYLFLRVPFGGDQNGSHSFLLAVTKHNVITISKGDLGIIEKVSSSRDFLISDKTAGITNTLSFISRSYGLNVRRILKEVRKDRRHLDSLGDKDILDLVSQEDSLNDYTSSLFPLMNVYSQLTKLKQIKFEGEETEIIDDLVIDLHQTLKTTQYSLKSISNMREYYNTALTNKLNKKISLLTMFTIFLTIPTVLGSIYGMNVALPLQSHPDIFMMLGLFVLGIWAVLLLLVKKLKIF